LLAEIQPIDLQTFLLQLQNNGRGARAVQYIYAVMHVIFEAAKQARLIAYNPCDGFSRPKYKKAKIEPPKIADLRKLMECESLTPWERAFYYVAFTTGMRKGEIMGLTWPCIDFSSRFLLVKQQVQLIKGEGSILVELKTESSYRKVHLSAHAIELLQAHYEDQKLEKGAVKGWQENDLVFPNGKGKAKDPSVLHQQYKRRLKEAGVSDIRFHNFRHKAITVAKVELHGENELVIPILPRKPTSSGTSQMVSTDYLVIIRNGQ
jgi:integrase